MPQHDAAPIAAARGVIHRLLGQRADEFDLQTINPGAGGRDVFEMEARGGKVTLRGSSATALSRAAYEYLRQACDAHICWEGARLELPNRLPNLRPTRVESPYLYRHCYNVCTFGYTTVWWDWQRWEREIDWLALHGVNMPLSLIGQSAIWQRVWREFGVGDEELADFFSGPAFLPWFWMGNMYGHGKPLTQNWIDSRRELQSQIMRRQLELGMTPVTPGFAGFVPPGLVRAHPGVKLLRSEARAYSDYTVPLLDPREPLFAQIGTRFIQEYTREYGTGHIYLADTFNELVPPFPMETRKQELASVSRAVYEAMAAGDPQAIYAMQGWTFSYFGQHWPADVLEAYLGGIPTDRLVILDLACDSVKKLPRFEPLRTRRWVYCVLHNFGQVTAAFGELRENAEGMAVAARDGQALGAVGAGATPEGIEQNSVVYELVFDMTWRSDAPDINAWLHDYARRRYGKLPPSMAKAWDLLERSIYRQRKEPIPIFCKRPLLKVRGGYKDALQYNPADLRDAVNLFLGCAEKLGAIDLYQRDLVDFLKQHLANVADKQMVAIAEAYRNRDAEGVRRRAKEFLELFQEIDTLVDTRPEYRLSAWVNAARVCATTPEDAAHYESNARLQVTRWGGPRSLTDYAHKEWAGLIRDYYVPRWRLFFDRLAQGAADQTYDEEAWHTFMDDWEARWPRETRTLSVKTATDTITTARRLFARYRDTAG